MAKTTRLRHISGETVEFTRVGDFARQRGLNPRPFYDVLSGRRRSHRGWSLVSVVEHQAVRVKSPEGRVHVVERLREFAREHGLDHSNLRKLLTGQLESTKGWRRVGGLVYEGSVVNSPGRGRAKRSR